MLLLHGQRQQLLQSRAATATKAGLRGGAATATRSGVWVRGGVGHLKSRLGGWVGGWAGGAGGWVGGQAGPIP